MGLTIIYITYIIPMETKNTNIMIYDAITNKVDSKINDKFIIFYSFLNLLKESQIDICSDAFNDLTSLNTKTIDYSNQNANKFNIIILFSIIIGAIFITTCAFFILNINTKKYSFFIELLLVAISMASIELVFFYLISSKYEIYTK